MPDLMNDPNAPGQVFGFRIDHATWGGNVLASPSYGDQTVKNLFFGGLKVGHAFMEACDPIVLNVAIHRRLRKEMAAVAAEIGQAFHLVVKVTEYAVFFGVAGMGILALINTPLALSVLRGARTGAAIATRLGAQILNRLGIVIALAATGPMLREAGKSFDIGVQRALDGDEGGAKVFIADGYAIVLSWVVVAIATQVMMRGLLGLRLPGTSKLASWVRGLPQPTHNLESAGRTLGRTPGELRHLIAESRGKMLIERGCNPERTRWAGRNVEAKGLNVHSHTLPAGARHAGAVGWDARNMAEYRAFRSGLERNYQIKRISPTEERIVVRPAAQPAAPSKVGAYEIAVDKGLNGYRLYHSPEGEIVLLNPKGMPVVGDVDRVVSYTLSSNGVMPAGYKTGPKGYYPDDAATEIALKNARYRRGVAPADRVGDTPYPHGECQRFGTVQFDEFGEPHFRPSYPAPNANGSYIMKDEPIAVALNGQLYILPNWHALRAFCLTNSRGGVQFPWGRIVTAEVRE